MTYLDLVTIFVTFHISFRTPPSHTSCSHSFATAIIISSAIDMSNFVRSSVIDMIPDATPTSRKYFTSNKNVYK